MKTKLRNSICALFPIALTYFALMPMAQAVGPDTEGAIAGANNGEGVGVLVSRTTGVWNTGTGFEALNHLTAGNQNTATGLRALFSDTNGGFNTATGAYSLFGNTSGFFNSATGAYSLAHNTIGSDNTANGYSALYFNTEGDSNTAIGRAALYKNTIGFVNTATGATALFSNKVGAFNTANGVSALFSNTGNDNTAIGAGALQGNTTGGENTAIGVSALVSNETGNNNVALGFFAGNQQTTGSDNIYIGFNIGGTAGESNACYIKSIFGQTSASGTPVFINANHKLGTTTSSQRFKEDIKPMDKASDALFALKPVAFRYKKEIDPTGISQLGLVAEDVEKVNPDLVVRDKEGKPYSVRYDQVNAMLLNEFLKEHRKNEEQEATIARLQKQVEALTAGLQKVSAQVQMSKAAPQVAEYNQ